MTRTHHDNPTCHATRRGINSPPTTSARCLGRAAAPTLSAGDRSRLFNDGRRGFTIIELLVAIAVASLLLFMVNFIFNDATRAVSRGIALSDIIANTRGANDQFALDAEEMIAPNATVGDPAGVLVIMNRRVTTTDYPDLVVRRGPGLDEVPPDSGYVQSDQLMFIRSGEQGSVPLNPLAPEQAGTYSNDREAPYAKVWYGHGKITNSAATNADELGEGGNRVANDWALCRQAMLLSEETMGNSVLQHNDADGNPGASYLGNFGGDSSVPYTDTFAYHGITDLAEQPLADLLSDLAPTDPYSLTTDADYRAAAYNYTYSSERLWVNPSPQYTGTSPYQYHAWQIGQMHSLFMLHCSDFIVEFAADIATGSGTTVAPDGEIDVDGDGDIRWYSHFPDNPDTNSYRAPTSWAPYDSTPAPTHADGVFVFRHDDDDPADSNWPYLIRIRYRMHDSRGVIESGDDQHGMWFEHVIKVNRP